MIFGLAQCREEANLPKHPMTVPTTFLFDGVMQFKRKFCIKYWPVIIVFFRYKYLSKAILQIPENCRPNFTGWWLSSKYLWRWGIHMLIHCIDSNLLSESHWWIHVSTPVNERRQNFSSSLVYKSRSSWHEADHADWDFETPNKKTPSTDNINMFVNYVFNSLSNNL